MSVIFGQEKIYVRVEETGVFFMQVATCYRAPFDACTQIASTAFLNDLFLLAGKFQAFDFTRPVLGLALL